MRGAIAILFALAMVPDGRAGKPNTTPRPSVMLNSSEGIIVQSRWDGATLYGLDGTPRQHFPLGRPLEQLTVSPDEQFLLLAGEGGRVRVWRIADGAQLLNFTVADARWVFDASFSGDGSTFSLLIAPYDHYSNQFVAVYLTDDGRLVGRVTRFLVSGIVLPADASVGRRLEPGKTISTEAFPQYQATTDSRYAFDLSDDRCHIRVVDVTTGRAVKNLDMICGLDHIRQVPDGSILMTGCVCSDDGHRTEAVGLRFDPATLEVTELWRHRYTLIFNRALDFDPKRGLGVTTNFALRTEVIDLKTGKTVLAIYTGASPYPPWWYGWSAEFWVCVALSPAILYGFWRLRRFLRRRAAAQCGGSLRQ
jgi:WD40 repeat protein